MNDFSYGFRIVGSCRNARRLVDARAAMAGYAACDGRAEVDSEAYLSAFQFGDAFRQHLQGTGSTKGYRGPCWSPWLWFDIDREDASDAVRATQRLAYSLVDRYRLDGDDLLLFFSGSKGFHVGLPTSLWSPEPSETFHRVARRFAEAAAERADVTIDTGVYDAVRAFRAPNSRHPKTGLHKRRLTLDELLHLTPTAIVQLATTPEAFDPPTACVFAGPAIDDWQAATEAIEQEAAAMAERRIANPAATLNRQTRAFLVEGAIAGDRHRLLFSAAANLAEFGCPAALAHALLSEPGLDSGLAPKEVRRQIDCGLEAKGGQV